MGERERLGREGKDKQYNGKLREIWERKREREGIEGKEDERGARERRIKEEKGGG